MRKTLLSTLVVALLLGSTSVCSAQFPAMGAPGETKPLVTVAFAGYDALHSDMELKAIVGATGFCDQSHMTKSFKRVFGVTPAECRRSG